MGIILIFVLFLGMIVLTLPIAFSMELSTVLTMIFNGQGNALITILTKLFSGTNSTSFLAIPFFILAGALMEQGGISDKILEFANGLVGHLRGSLAMVTVLYATLFSAVTGSAVAATTAVGATMMPAMNKKGYDKGFTAALQASAGTLGPIIPPSVSMIMISAMTGESVANLFLAGFLPGFMIAAFLMLVGYLYARKHDIPKEPKQSGKETRKAFTSAVWALLSPVIIIGGILSKFVDFGMPLERVLDAATLTPATLVGHPELGTLKPGTPADICILKQKKKQVFYTDINGNSFLGTQVLVPQMTFKDGQCMFCQADFT